jgi:hypothetical protein
VFFDKPGNYLGWEEHFVGTGALFPLSANQRSGPDQAMKSDLQTQYERLVSGIGGCVAPILERFTLAQPTA